MLIRETIVHTQTISSMLSQPRKYLKRATELVGTLIRTSFSFFLLIQSTAHRNCSFAMIIINDTSMRILSISHHVHRQHTATIRLPGKFVAIDRQSCTRDGVRPVRGMADQLTKSGTVHLT